MQDYLYTVAETAEILKTNKNYVYNLFKHNLLKPLKLGNLKVRKEELERFLEWSQGKDLTDLNNIKELVV